MTIQTAWRVLREEGTIHTRHGTGVFVRRIPEPARDLLAEIDELRAAVTELRERVHTLEQRPR